MIKQNKLAIKFDTDFEYDEWEMKKEKEKLIDEYYLGDLNEM